MQNAIVLVVALVQVENEDKVVVVEDLSHARPCLKFPGGSIEQGESPLEAAARELFEETGISLKEAQNVLDHTHDIVLHEITPQGVALAVHVVEAHFSHTAFEDMPPEGDIFEGKLRLQYARLPLPGCFLQQHRARIRRTDPDLYMYLFGEHR